MTIAKSGNYWVARMDDELGDQKRHVASCDTYWGAVRAIDALKDSPTKLAAWKNTTKRKRKKRRPTA